MRRKKQLSKREEVVVGNLISNYPFPHTSQSSGTENRVKNERRRVGVTLTCIWPSPLGPDAKVILSLSKSMERREKKGPEE